MKIDRVTSENLATFNTINSEKLIRQEKNTFTTDAVTFDGERSKGETQFNRRSSDKDKENLPDSDLEDKEKEQAIYDKKRILDLIV